MNNVREINCATVIGVKNRNLHDFSVDMGTANSLVDTVRWKDVVLCALSGTPGSKDVRVYQEQGVNAVLVEEALMRADNTKAFIQDLLEWPEV